MSTTRERKGRRVGCPEEGTELAPIWWRSASWQGGWRAVAEIATSALKYGCIAWGLTKAAQVLIAWTGQDTKASVNLNVLVNFLDHRATGYLAPWLVVFATWMLYRREKRLKEETMTMLGAVKRKYESLRNSRGNSSHILASRNSNPSDLP